MHFRVTMHVNAILRNQMLISNAKMSHIIDSALSLSSVSIQQSTKRLCVARIVACILNLFVKYFVSVSLLVNNKRKRDLNTS